jgi:beta-N-acetylhexosaminidase
MARGGRLIDAARRGAAGAVSRVRPIAATVLSGGRRAARTMRAHLRTPQGRREGAVLMVALFALLVIVIATRDSELPGPGSGDGDRASGQGDGSRGPVGDALADMSTRDKVAQLMLVGLEGADADDPVLKRLEERGYAGIVLDQRNYESANQVEGLADDALSGAEDAGHVTPFVMAAQEGGALNSFADLPPDDAPADLGSPDDVEEAAGNAADALAEVGLTGVLGPVVDVGTESGSPLGERLYSDEPDRVSDYALTTFEAFDRADLFAAAKHFPGLGATSETPEVGPANVGLTLEQLAERDLVPFEALIEAGVPGVVVGHGLYGVEDFVTPASTSEAILTDLLRDDLGFEGVAITDDLTSPAITGAFTPPRAAVDAVRAGADLVHVSFDDQEQTEVHEALLDAVRSDRIPAERLDEAVRRTLEAKDAVGLLEEGEDGGGGGDRDSGGSGQKDGG